MDGNDPISKGITAPSTQAFGDAAAKGVANDVALSDHKHGIPSTIGILGGQNMPSNQAFGDAANKGVATDAALSDHKHGMPATPATIPNYQHILVCFAAPSSIGQGTWIENYAAVLSDYAIEELVNSTGANGDNVSFTISLKAGNYKGVILYGTNTSYGIIQTLLDGTQIDSSDSYAAAIGVGKKVIAQFTIATDGDHVLKFNVNGKNGSSSGYTISLSKVAIGRVS